MDKHHFNLLVQQIKQCKVCEPNLELGANPIISVALESKIVIIGQAPGLKVHQSGIPWHDKSGDTLRMWLGVDKQSFYNPKNFALLPMGFCYPGKGKSGDLPPRKECAPLWHSMILNQLKQVRLIILIGNYAQKYYLKDPTPTTLTQRVKQYNTYLPQFLPLPHPSPRNFIWQANNPWFDQEVLPELQKLVGQIILRNN